MNNCTYVGRLTRDVELRGKDQNVASSGIAVPRVFRRDGDPETDFFTVTVIGNRAKSFAQYAHSGSRVSLSGRTYMQSYTNKDNQKVTYGEIMVNDFELLDPKPADTAGNGPHQNTGMPQQRPVQQTASQPTPVQTAQPQSPAQQPAPWNQAPQTASAPAQNSGGFALPDEGSLPWEQ